MSSEINESENVEKEKRQEIQRLSKIANKLSSHYRLFTMVKYKLDKYGISMEKLDQFVKCVVGIAKENYNVTNILEKMRDYDNFVYYIQYYSKEVETKKDQLNQLNHDINNSKETLYSYRIK